jgi:hypothetical protein
VFVVLFGGAASAATAAANPNSNAGALRVLAVEPAGRSHVAVTVQVNRALMPAAARGAFTASAAGRAIAVDATQLATGRLETALAFDTGSPPSQSLGDAERAAGVEFVMRAARGMPVRILGARNAAPVPSPVGAVVAAGARPPSSADVRAFASEVERNAARDGTRGALVLFAGDATAARVHVTLQALLGTRHVALFVLARGNIEFPEEIAATGGFARSYRSDAALRAAASALAQQFAHQWVLTVPATTEGHVDLALHAGATTARATVASLRTRPYTLGDTAARAEHAPGHHNGIDPVLILLGVLLAACLTVAVVGAKVLWRVLDVPDAS